MLTALIRHAEHAGLSAEAGFAPKDIRWVAHLSGGKLTGVVGGDKKGKTYPKAPDLAQPEMIALPAKLGQKQAAHFLADTCAVVALLPATDKDGNVKTDAKSVAEAAKASDKHPTFLELLRRAAEAVPPLNDVLDMLQDPEQLARLQADLTREGAKPTDKITFSVAGEDLLAGESWHSWWRTFRRETFGREESEGGGGLMLDLTSGEAVTPANTHPKLTKLGVGAIATGASLVGFDKEAFGSYGLEQGQNSAISEANTAAYRAALDDLLSKAPTLGQMKVAAWFDRRPAEGQALIDAITDPATLDDITEDGSWDDYDGTQATVFYATPEQQEAVAHDKARKLLQAIRKGEQPDEKLTAHYFALAMSGASGRAMVRDWKTGTLESLSVAVTRWFDDLAIVNAGGKVARKPKFFSLLMSVQRPKLASTSLDDYLKPVRNLQLPLWRAALDPQMPIPFAALTKIMESHKAHVMTGKFSEGLGRDGDNEEKGRIYTRMALLRAYHVRKARIQGGYSMTQALDPNHPSPAYHCGRLMYLLANVQDAQGQDIGAGVVQRYYGAASSTPALVLGRLTRLSQHHLAKIGRDKPGLAYRLEEEIAAVWAKLGSRLPRTLSLEEQSLFALGYYQQLAASSTARREAAERNKMNNVAPDTQATAFADTTLTEGA